MAIELSKMKILCHNISPYVFNDVQNIKKHVQKPKQQSDHGPTNQSTQ